MGSIPLKEALSEFGIPHAVIELHKAIKSCKKNKSARIQFEIYDNKLKGCKAEIDSDIKDILK